MYDLDPAALNDADLLQMALQTLLDLGGFDGAHHKQFAIDQAVRVLTRCPLEPVQAKDVNGKPYSYNNLGESDTYRETIRTYCDGEDGPHTYSWEEGICP